MEEGRRPTSASASWDLPEIDRAMRLELVDEFEQVMAKGTNPQKKHLLHRPAKKVLVHDRRTVEV